MKTPLITVSVRIALAVCLYFLIPTAALHAQCTSCQPHGAVNEVIMSTNGIETTQNIEATLPSPVKAGTKQSVNVYVALYAGAKGPISFNCFTEGKVAGTVFTGSIPGTSGQVAFYWIPTVAGSYELFCTAIAYGNPGQNSMGTQPLYATVD